MGNQLANALPNPMACNNIKCKKMASMTESAAIKGGRCSACKTAHYCSVDCQKAHRASHKAVCKVLKEHGSGLDANV
jgi:hypothetical protein